MKPRGNRREKNRVTSNGKQHGHPETPMSTLASNSATCSSDVNNIKDEEDIFPRFSPWVVCALTMAIRVNYVCQPKNWWILHPDEIFQTLEVAHSEVYGYGFRTHEYLPVPGDMNMTEMRYSEVKMGMHSMRSFLLPRFFIMVSWLAGMLGYSGRPFMLWKVAHVLVSSCLPLAVYRFSRTLFRSHDTGVISAILTATSTQLSVFGTHTLINSFIGTPLFYALALLVENMLSEPSASSSEGDTLTKSNDNDKNKCLSHQIYENGGTISNGTLISNGSVKIDDGHRNMNGIKSGIKNDDTFPPLPNGTTWGLLLSNGYSYVYGNGGTSLQMNGGFHRNVTDANPFTHPEVSSSEHRDSNMNIIPERHISQPSSVETKFYVKRLASASFLLVLCCYIRVDASLFVLLTSLPFFTRKWLRKENVYPCIFGSFVGCVLCVVDDFNSYGFGVISPYHWFQFNVVREYSAAIYGRMDWTWYFSPLFYDNTGQSVLLSISSITVIIYGLKYRKLSELDQTRYKSAFKLSVILLILMLIYSTKGHKELRFLYNFLVLLYFMFAYCIFMIAKNVLSGKSRYASQACISVTLVTYILSQWSTFPSSMDKSLQTWTYTGNTHSHDVITCFDHVSKQNDVTGVFSDEMVHMSGGYTVLHKNVPILGLIHYEFYEFSLKTRTIMPSTNLFSSKRNISLSTFTQISEFVSMYRSSYLLKLLITRKKYNYVIISAEGKFLPIGYDEVFRSGTKRVLKRNPDSTQVRQLDSFASKISLGTNATILTYEADWLMRFNQLKLAKQRLAKALDLEPTFVEAYKLLALCYTVLGDTHSSGVVMGKCMTVVSKKRCYENPKRIYLHSAYKFIL